MTWTGRQGDIAAAARCHAAEGALAYAPVVAWLRSPALRRRLAALEPVWATELARLLPELPAERPGLARPGPVGEANQRQRLFEALARAVLERGRAAAATDRRSAMVRPRYTGVAAFPAAFRPGRPASAPRHPARRGCGRQPAANSPVGGAAPRRPTYGLAPCAVERQRSSIVGCRLVGANPDAGAAELAVSSVGRQPAVSY